MGFSNSHLPFLALVAITLAAIHPTTAIVDRPRGLILPITKDVPTSQYLTRIQQRTPVMDLPLVVDLGARYTWVDCEQDYLSSSFRPVGCQANECSSASSTGCGECFASSARPGCNRNTCIISPTNPFTGVTTPGELSEDAVLVRTTAAANASSYNPQTQVTIPRVLFSCAPRSLTQGLATGARGMVAFGRTPVSMPSQFASALGTSNVFALCLPSAADKANPGVAVFGSRVPYQFLGDVDMSTSMIYTPLILNPVSTAMTHIAGEASSEYFIQVNSIQVAGRPLPVAAALLTIDRNGNGGTKISTTTPYTILQTSIYRALTDAFTASTQLSRVAPVAPFGECFSSRGLGSSRMGPNVPTIDLMVESRNGYWRMFGHNSVVQVRPGVMCLAFVDGGQNPRTSIVLGAYQLENNLIQFDIDGQRVGFSGSLFSRRTGCARFRWNANATATSV